MIPKIQSKHVYIGLGAIAVGFLLWKVASGDTGGADSDPTGNGDPGSSNTGPKFDAKKTAQALYDLMKVTNWLSKNDEVLNILGKVSQAQFGQVFAAFGKKPYNKLLGNQLFWAWETPTSYDLAFWMKQELPSEHYEFWSAKYPQYLK